MIRLPAVVLTLLMCVGLGACARTLPIYNVDSMPVVSGSGAELSADQVRTAIVDAAHSKGWSVQDGAGGRLLATLYVRSHMAEVEIDYSPKAYGISYVNSENLLYNGSNIHRNYNKWIQLLETRINEELRRL